MCGLDFIKCAWSRMFDLQVSYDKLGSLLYVQCKEIL